MRLFSRLRWAKTLEARKSSNDIKALPTSANLKLDGKYTKMLCAFAKMCGLQHEVNLGKTNFGTSAEVSVTVKNKWYHSALDVIEQGKVAYVSSMREYVPNAQEDTVELLSKKIVTGLFGCHRYI